MNRRKTDELIDEPADAELEQWLAAWQPPEVPARLDAEVRAAYRRAFPPRPWWRRWLTVSVRVPLPLAAAIGIVLCAALWLSTRSAMNWLPPPVANVPPTKFVEVPVVQERLVTRVIYVKSNKGGEKRLVQPATALRVKTIPKQTDLAGFRPVSEIRLEISQGGQEP